MCFGNWTWVRWFCTGVSEVGIVSVGGVNKIIKQWKSFVVYLLKVVGVSWEQIYFNANILYIQNLNRFSLHWTWIVVTSSGLLN